MDAAELEPRLADFLSEFREDLNDEGRYLMRLGDWYFGKGDTLPFHDFNREILHPGESNSLPEGALGIRVDDDFWIVALLPYEYAVLDIRTLVRIIWPDIYPTAEFNPDSDDVMIGS
jgi:hypothetical protein